MRDISSWSIRNPIPVIMLFIMLTLGGVSGFNAMRINNNPDIDFPLIYVNASRPGAAPTEMETQVTRLIEDKIAGLSGVRHMRSTVQDGVSVTVIEFELSTDVERATNDVRNAMSGLMGSLPQDMQEPIVQRIDITGDPLITWVVRSGSMTPEQLSWFVDNEVSRALLAIPGVGEVNRLGGVDREIRIDLDPDRLASFGVTAATVSQALVNVNNDMPGGRVTVSGSERSIRTLGAAGSVQEAGRHARAGGRRQRAAGRPGPHRGQLDRAPVPRPLRRPGGHHLQLPALARGQRGEDRRTRARRDRQDRRGASGAADRAGQRLRRVRRGELHRLAGVGGPGRPAGGHRGLAVPARLAGDPDRRGGHAPVADPDFRGARALASRST